MFAKDLESKIKQRFEMFGVASNSLAAVVHLLDPTSHGVILEEVNLMDSTKREVCRLNKEYSSNFASGRDQVHLDVRPWDIDNNIQFGSPSEENFEKTDLNPLLKLSREESWI